MQIIDNEVDDIHFYDKGEYEEYIKKACFICEVKIPGTFEYYQKFGNCCAECSSRAGLVSSKKMREEFADYLLIERRKDVLSGKIKT